MNGRSFVASVVPHDDLARIGAGDDQVGMELGKTARSDPTRAVEDVLGRVGLELGVPNQRNAIRIEGRVLIRS